MARTNPQQFLLVSGAARRGKCSADTVRRAVDRGDLAALRTPDGVRLIDERDCDRWVAERRRRSTDSAPPEAA